MFLIKFSIFTAEKILCILHGQVSLIIVQTPYLGFWHLLIYSKSLTDEQSSLAKDQNNWQNNEYHDNSQDLNGRLK